MARPAQIFSRILALLLQFAAFAALFQVGGAWAEIRLAFEMKALQKLTPIEQMNALQQHKPLTHTFPLILWHIKPTLDYVANGLVFASALFVLILIFEALRRLRPWAALTLLAFLLAFGCSLLLHSGFVPLTNS